jgi:hypothetical protein
MAREDAPATSIDPWSAYWAAQSLSTRSRVGRVRPKAGANAVPDARAAISTGTPADWFGPLDPIAPQAPPEVKGRLLDFPSGYNLATQPRTYEPISFGDLRALADSYDLLRLVIETRKDQMARLGWSIRKRNLDPARAATTPAADPRTAALEAFFRSPDRVHGWDAWLRMLLEDMLVIDAPALYKQRRRDGRLFALLPLDGATVKRVIDDWGRTPAPPAPAFQQILKGLPAIDYTADELVYAPRNRRTHKIYGFSPVEQVVTTVAIALRRQTFLLQYYTEGNVPEALIGTPEAWTPDQIREYQDYWDSYFEGNTASRRHAKFVPGGIAKTFIQTKEPDLKSPFDEWLARVVCFAFSVSPQPFVERMNRATAESAHDTGLEEGLAPLKLWVKQLVDGVLASELDAADLEFAWADERAVDPMAAAQIAQIYVQTGIKSVDEARAEIGLAPLAHGAGAVPTAEPATALPAVAKAYNPDEPRVPAAQTGGGEWTSGGGGEDGKGDPGRGGTVTAQITLPLGTRCSDNRA